MALSYHTYAGTGSQVDFTFSKGYIEASHVEVLVDAVLKTVTTDYTWFNDTTVRFNVAPAGSTLVRLQRATPNTARLVDFQDAGNLTEVDLDNSALQMFYLTQESIDDSASSITLDADDKWDGQSKILKDLLDPTSAQDAATKEYVDNGVSSSVAAAAASAAAALVSENAAAADLVLTNADVVLTHADVALTNADVVSTNANAASTAADLMQTNIDQLGCAAALAATLQDTLDTAADAVSTAADAAATAADLLLTDADQVAAAASAAAAAASAASIDAAAMKNRKNLIINGDFGVDQKQATYTGVANGEYTLDRWRYTSVGTCVLDAIQATTTDDVPFQTYLELDVTTADASMAATDIYMMSQRILGHDVKHLKLGSANASTVTVSFWSAHTATGSYSVSLVNGALNRYYSSSYTQAVADTWEYQEVTIALDVTGTWTTANDNGLQLNFVLASGSNYQAAAGAWAVGHKPSTPIQDNGVASASNFLRLADVQIEENTTATAFDRQSFAEQLENCERFWRKSYGYDSAVGTVSNVGAATFVIYGQTSAARAAGNHLTFASRMIAAPTVTTYSTLSGTSGKVYDNSAAGDLNSTTQYQGETGFRWHATTAVQTNADLAMHWTADAEL